MVKMPPCPSSRIGHSIDLYSLLVPSVDEELDKSLENSSDESDCLSAFNSVYIAEFSSVIRGTWEAEYGEKLAKKWPNMCSEHLKLCFSRNRLDKPFIQECASIINTNNYHFDPQLKYKRIDFIIMYGGIICDNSSNPTTSTTSSSGLSQSSVDAFLKASNWVACDQMFTCNLQDYKQQWKALEFAHGLSRRAFHSTAVVYALQGIPLIFLFGGLEAKDKVADNKLYFMQLYDHFKSFDKWSELPTDNPRPPPRYGHTLRLVRHYLVLFGGIVDDQLTNDLWVLNLKNLSATSNKWEKIYFPGLTPTPRSFHSAVSVGKTKYSMLIYGGITKITNRNRIYALCITGDNQWIWKIFPVIVKFTPDIRAFHTMHIIDRNVVIVGGEDYSKKNGIGLQLLIYCMREKTFFYRNQTIPMAGHASWVSDSLIHSFGGLAEPGMLPPGIVTCNPLGYSTSNMALVYYFRLIGNEEGEGKKRNEIEKGEAPKMPDGIDIDYSNQICPKYDLASAYVEPAVTYPSRTQRSSAFKAMQAIKRDMKAHKKIEENDNV